MAGFGGDVGQLGGGSDHQLVAIEVALVVLHRLVGADENTASIGQKFGFLAVIDGIAADVVFADDGIASDDDFLAVVQVGGDNRSRFEVRTGLGHRAAVVYCSFDG